MAPLHQPAQDQISVTHLVVDLELHLCGLQEVACFAMRSMKKDRLMQIHWIR